MAQSFRDGIFSASATTASYGSLLTAYSDGALGESKIGRPVTNAEAGASKVPYYPDPDKAIPMPGWWEEQKISWRAGAGPKSHLVVYSLGAVALGVIAWLVFRKK